MSLRHHPRLCVALTLQARELPGELCRAARHDAARLVRRHPAATEAAALVLATTFALALAFGSALALAHHMETLR